jgi:antitoxin component YwqK of YwqJK toxin-antitoxin module
VELYNKSYKGNIWKYPFAKVSGEVRKYISYYLPLDEVIGHNILANDADFISKWMEVNKGKDFGKNLKYKMQWYPSVSPKNLVSYFSDIKHGLEISFHSNGKVQSSCRYNLGKKEGMCLEWYENGERKLECGYDNDVKHSYCREYNKAGNPTKYVFYMYGEITNTWI